MGCSSSKAPAVKSDSSMYEMPTPSKDESLPWPDEEVGNERSTNKEEPNKLELEETNATNKEHATESQEESNSKNEGLSDKVPEKSQSTIQDPKRSSTASDEKMSRGSITTKRGSVVIKGFFKRPLDEDPELPNRERGLTVASKLFGLVDGSDEPDKAEISEPAAATESGAGGELPAENAEHRNSAGDGSLSVKKMSIEAHDAAAKMQALYRGKNARAQVARMVDAQARDVANGTGEEENPTGRSSNADSRYVTEATAKDDQVESSRKSASIKIESDGSGTEVAEKQEEVKEGSVEESTLENPQQSVSDSNQVKEASPREADAGSPTNNNALDDVAQSDVDGNKSVNETRPPKLGLIYQDLMEKVGGGTSLLGRKNWKTRWFALYPTTIKYYKTRQDFQQNPESPLGEVRLSSDTSIIVTDVWVNERRGDVPHIQIRAESVRNAREPRQRDFLLRALDKKSHDSWESNIRSAIEQVRRNGDAGFVTKRSSSARV